MSTFKSPKAAAAALVFLVLYTFYTIAAISNSFRIGWKTVYSFLVFYGLVRFGSQLCGVVFSAVGLDHYQWLIAYLILGAQGYFTLVYCGFHFIVKGQRDKYGYSWLDPTKEQQREILDSPSSSMFHVLTAKYPIWRSFKMLLIAANVLVIYGGSSTAGKSIDELNADPDLKSTAKICRTVGQAFFLVLTFVVIGVSYYSYLIEKVQNSYPLKSVMFASPFLIVRGIFGIISIFIPDMDYYSTQNYTANGLNAKFVVYEYVLGTTMEFIAGSLFIASSYLTQSKQKQTVIVEESKSFDSEIDIPKY